MRDLTVCRTHTALGARHPEPSSVTASVAPLPSRPPPPRLPHQSPPACRPWPRLFVCLFVLFVCRFRVYSPRVGGQADCSWEAAEAGNALKVSSSGPSVRDTTLVRGRAAPEGPPAPQRGTGAGRPGLGNPGQGRRRGLGPTQPVSGSPGARHRLSSAEGDI